jgi:hypothetical protein
MPKSPVNIPVSMATAIPKAKIINRRNETVAITSIMTQKVVGGLYGGLKKILEKRKAQDVLKVKIDCTRQQLDVFYRL